MEEEEKSGIRITDRRRFDYQGNERDEAGAQALGGTSTKSSVEADSPPSVSEKVMSLEASMGALQEEVETNRDESDGHPQSIDFSSFIMSLATQALMQLGEVAAPDGIHLPVDKSAAKQTIDILGMLKDKTTGNLDGTEERLMEEILHTLRMSFVRHVA